MIKLADVEIETYIKLTQIRDQFKEGSCYTFKDKLIRVAVEKPTVVYSTCFKDTKKGRKELLKWIKKECCL